jgi:hypothetical protein
MHAPASATRFLAALGYGSACMLHAVSKACMRTHPPEASYRFFACLGQRQHAACAPLQCSIGSHFAAEQAWGMLAQQDVDLVSVWPCSALLMRRSAILISAKSSFVPDCAPAHTM